MTRLEALPPRLAGKVALVTGGARGLGRAYALRLARLGADVAVNDVSLHANREFDEALTPGCDTVVDEIRALDRRALGVEADVTDEAQVQRMVDRIQTEWGRVDAVVCNAGGALVPGGHFAGALEIPDFLRTLGINLLGTIHTCKAVAPLMKAQRSGKIVTVGSLAGLRAEVESQGRGTSYAVAKAAVHHYTRKLATELGPYGVTVNCIAPGWALSSRALAGGRNEGVLRDRLVAQVALGRLGLPEDCARVVEFLCTDLSDYVTGQVLSVCGGARLF